MIFWIFLCGYLAWRVWKSFEAEGQSSKSQARVVKKTVFCHPSDFHEPDFLRGVQGFFTQWQTDPKTVQHWLDEAWHNKLCPLSGNVTLHQLSCEDKQFDLKQWEVRVKIAGENSPRYAIFVRHPRQDHPHWILRTLI